MDPRPTTAPMTDHWARQRRFHVTYHDIDVLNHLNHATYFPYMETLRCDYYLPLLGTTDPQKLDIIVAEASCRYLAPVGYGTELLGEVAPARPLGRTSFILLYRFVDPERTVTYARGKTVVVCFDYAQNRKKEIAANIRAQMESDAVEPGADGFG
ncbi:MAG: acyl-CoA thioesterase [Thermoplasmata archaeon]|nr:acyl-CoA thioesterase [Thermoplasmata archaeon]